MDVFVLIRNLAPFRSIFEHIMRVLTHYLSDELNCARSCSELLGVFGAAWSCSELLDVFDVWVSPHCTPSAGQGETFPIRHRSQGASDHCINVYFHRAKTVGWLNCTRCEWVLWVSTPSTISGASVGEYRFLTMGTRGNFIVLSLWDSGHNIPRSNIYPQH